LEDSPAPSSFGLTENYYNSASDIFKVALSVFGKLPPDNLAEIFFMEKPHDIPGDWFKGPF
jgi:acetoin:2,6-dichlorophenolindophenol oxidoreductase subunit beta